MLPLLFKLILGHFIADIPLQSKEMGKQKNPYSQSPKAYDPTVHGPMFKSWMYYMAAHASIHASVVWLLTGRYEWGMVEFFAHYVTDTIKSYFRLPIHIDQAAHLAFKVIYAYILTHPT